MARGRLHTWGPPRLRRGAPPRPAIRSHAEREGVDITKRARVRAARVRSAADEAVGPALKPSGRLLGLRVRRSLRSASVGLDRPRRGHDHPRLDRPRRGHDHPGVVAGIVAPLAVPQWRAPRRSRRHRQSSRQRVTRPPPPRVRPAWHRPPRPRWPLARRPPAHRPRLRPSPSVTPRRPSARSRRPPPPRARPRVVGVRRRPVRGRPPARAHQSGRASCRRRAEHREADPPLAGRDDVLAGALREAVADVPRLRVERRRPRSSDRSAARGLQQPVAAHSVELAMSVSSEPIASTHSSNVSYRSSGL